MSNIISSSIKWLLLASIFVNSCEQGKKGQITTGGHELVPFTALPFEIKDVKLLDGPFLHATELNIKSLLNYDPDRLLAKFRIEAGLESKADHYGGWEAMSLAGHSLGHYLRACALMYQTTGDDIFLERVNYMVDELAACQESTGKGYLGAVPGARTVFEEEIPSGDIRTRRFNLNDIWAPLYTQHKILAGLIEAYTLCNNHKALEAARKFVDWMDDYMSQLGNEEIQEMLGCEHGGINECLAELYAVTGEDKYLKLARKFYHEDILKPLSKGLDILPGNHANTQIPKLIGLARIYELSGDSREKETAEFFWDRVVNHHSYVTGGHCDHEYFGPADSLRNRLSEGTAESCNVYNMLKLTSHLFQWDGSVQVADFYERALFNHILSSQHPADGRVIYNLSLEMGGYKVYQDPEWFTCCVGTGMENHSKYAGNIYFHNNNELFVVQYIGSLLNWEEKGFKLRQITAYPEEQGSTLLIESHDPVRLTINIRYPYWARNGMELSINGKIQKIRQEPGSFVALNRIWEQGDSVSIVIPFPLRIESMPDDPDRVSILYGPLVLAGDLGPVDDPHAHDRDFVPEILAESRDPAVWLKHVEGKNNTFRMKDAGHPRDIELKPFYVIHDRRYTVYWDLFNKKKWAREQEKQQTESVYMKDLWARTLDYFQPGDSTSESDHGFQAENSSNGWHMNRQYRTIYTGSMSCEMKIKEGQALTLMIDYWGGFSGARTFDLIVNDSVITTENISDRNSGDFIASLYEIPDALISGKPSIKVSLRPHEGNRGGPVYGMRIIKED